jgi:hypothetical protein
MAGSYRHATLENGKLRSPATMPMATETTGDAYETIQEMYGMIWYLAGGSKSQVEFARQQYRMGIEFSPGIEDA